jgi:hypothetical protein
LTGYEMCAVKGVWFGAVETSIGQIQFSGDLGAFEGDLAFEGGIFAEAHSSVDGDARCEESVAARI